MATITIILPVSYTHTVRVQRNLTPTVIGRREMNKVRCHVCGSTKTPSTVITLQGQEPLAQEEANSLQWA